MAHPPSNPPGNERQMTTLPSLVGKVVPFAFLLNLGMGQAVLAFKHCKERYAHTYPGSLSLHQAHPHLPGGTVAESQALPGLQHGQSPGCASSSSLCTVVVRLRLLQCIRNGVRSAGGVSARYGMQSLKKRQIYRTTPGPLLCSLVLWYPWQNSLTFTQHCC